MDLVRALLACMHLLQFCAYEKLAECCDSCARCVSGLTTGLTQPVRNLFISVKALAVLYWKVAFTIISVPCRVWDLLYTWCTASCYMLSRCSRLSRDIPYACLSLLCCICSQMQEAALHLLWLWIPSGIQTICTALAHSCRSTGTKGSHPAPPSRASFEYGSFVTSKIIRIAMSHSTALLLDGSYACLALLCQIYSQMQEAVLQLLWSGTPGWIQIICSALVAHSEYSTGTKGSGPAPPRTVSFAFGSFCISKIIRVAVSRCTALLLDGSCACLALLCHIRSQLQKAALHLLWSWTPGWIQTTCTIFAFLWQNTGKEGPAAAPPETACFGFGVYIVVIVRRVRTCPAGLPPSPSEGALDPVFAPNTHGNDSSRNQHQSSVPDNNTAGSEATKVRFSLQGPCHCLVALSCRPTSVCLAL